MHGYIWVDQDGIGLMIILKNSESGLDPIQFFWAGLDSNGEISQSIHLC